MLAIAFAEIRAVRLAANGIQIQFAHQLGNLVDCILIIANPEPFRLSLHHAFVSMTATAAFTGTVSPSSNSCFLSVPASVASI